MVSRDVYPTLPKDESGNRFARYSELLDDFIRDVRNDLDAPNMPFVIGVMGVGGAQANEGNLEFREAMAAPAAAAPRNISRRVSALPLTYSMMTGWHISFSSVGAFVATWQMGW